MAKDEDIAARALCQLLKAGFIADGMDPAIATILAGKACAAGVKKVARDVKKKKAAGKKKLNSWQQYVKTNSAKFKYKSGSKKGQVNFKALSREFKRRNKK